MLLQNGDTPALFPVIVIDVTGDCVTGQGGVDTLS